LVVRVLRCVRLVMRGSRTAAVLVVRVVPVLRVVLLLRAVLVRARLVLVSVLVLRAAVTLGSTTSGCCSVVPSRHGPYCVDSRFRPFGFSS
jgi:hypothetical protein